MIAYNFLFKVGYILDSCPECGHVRPVRVNRKGSRCASCRLSHLSLDRGHNWKGGEIFHQGYYYTYMPKHHRASGGYVKRAVLVLEEKLGRLLLDNEDCHHINEIKVDDSPDNLEVKTKGGHATHHNHKSGKAKNMMQYRWPIIKEWDGISHLVSGALIHGNRLGKLDNKIYIYSVCPKCQVGYWKLRLQQKRLKHPLLCKLCSSINNLPNKKSEVANA